MTVKQAIEALEKCPPDAVIVALGEYEGEFTEIEVENEHTLTDRDSFIDAKGQASGMSGDKVVVVLD